MPRWITIEERCREKTGMEIDVFLKNANAAGMSLRQVSRTLGCGGRHPVMNAIRRYGIDWKTASVRDNSAYTHITIDGITTTRKAHCDRLGVSKVTVDDIRREFDLTFPEALAVAAGRKERRARRAAS